MTETSGVSRGPIDPCRTELVDVDGEQVPVRVQGGSEWDDTERGYFADIVRAATRRFRRSVTLVALPQQPEISAVLREHIEDPRGRRRAAHAVRQMLRNQWLRVPADLSGGDHLLARHVDAFNAAERDPENYPGKLRFENGYGIDFLPPGQWLLAYEHCREFHHFQTTGDPCWCGSDNCGYCARCGVEGHD